jgi:hypothetical protein
MLFFMSFNNIRQAVNIAFYSEVYTVMNGVMALREAG